MLRVLLGVLLATRAPGLEAQVLKHGRGLERPPVPSNAGHDVRAACSGNQTMPLAVMLSRSCDRFDTPMDQLESCLQRLGLAAQALPAALAGDGPLQRLIVGLSKQHTQHAAAEEPAALSELQAALLDQQRQLAELQAEAAELGGRVRELRRRLQSAVVVLLLWWRINAVNNA